MPNKKEDPKDVKNKTIAVLVSDNDLEKHGGRDKLSKKFRELRDKQIK